MAQFIGFAFPFQKGATSFPATAVDDELIKHSLVQLVLTGTGERIMRPDFGGKAHAYIFQANDDVLQQVVEAELFFLIGRYEPRVAVTSIEAVRGDEIAERMPTENESASVVITINYVVLATKKLGSVTITISAGSAG